MDDDFSALSASTGPATTTLTGWKSLHQYFYLAIQTRLDRSRVQPSLADMNIGGGDHLAATEMKQPPNDQERSKCCEYSLEHSRAAGDDLCYNVILYGRSPSFAPLFFAAEEPTKAFTVTSTGSRTYPGKATLETMEFMSLDDVHDGQAYFVAVKLNTRFLKLGPHNDESIFDDDYQDVWSISSQQLGMHINRMDRFSIDQPMISRLHRKGFHGSRMDMLLTQPPITRVWAILPRGKVLESNRKEDSCGGKSGEWSYAQTCCKCTDGQVSRA
ncbi:hypothetical protein Slin14017_G114110 [Septoria linicola]|nr:hypothetical protein Slin14017_G114110 [Septoria linicola]